MNDSADDLAEAAKWLYGEPTIIEENEQMDEIERDHKIEALIYEFHETRSIAAACEACDLLYEGLTEGVESGEY
jgi:hypothetical protein